MQDLFDYITSRGCLPESEAAHLLAEIVRLSLECYRHGVLHRDLKDENLLLEMHTNPRRLRLIDFGSGCFVNPAAGNEQPYTDFDGMHPFTPFSARFCTRTIVPL